MPIGSVQVNRIRRLCGSMNQVLGTGCDDGERINNRGRDVPVTCFHVSDGQLMHMVLERIICKDRIVGYFVFDSMYINSSLIIMENVVRRIPRSANNIIIRINFNTYTFAKPVASYMVISNIVFI